MSQRIEGPNGERVPLLASAASIAAPPSAPKVDGARFVALLFALYLCVFLAALDTTILSTLMSTIASDLNELDNISWTATSYLVAYSAAQPVYGKLSDIYGRKTVLICSALLFGLGCQICGSGTTLQPLIIGRTLSGLGAGGMLAMSTITVSDYVPVRQRGIYQGIGNIAFGIGASAGGLFGAWAASYGGWRLAFTAQVPMTAVVIALSLLLVENTKADPEEVVTSSHATDHVVHRTSWERLDVVGTVALACSQVLFMIAVTTGGVIYPWSSYRILLCFAGSAALLPVFYYWEKYHAFEPVMPIDLLTTRSIWSALCMNFLCSGMSYVTLYYGPIYLVALYNYTSDEISYRIVASFIGVSIGSMSSGLIMKHTGKYKKLGLTATSLMVVPAIMMFMVPQIPFAVAHSFAYQAVVYFINGLAYSAVLTVTLVSLIASVKPSLQATVTSTQYVFRGSGSSAILAICAFLFHKILVGNLNQEITGPGSAKIIKRVSKSVDAIRDLPDDLVEKVVRCYAKAGMGIYLFTIIIGIAGIFCCMAGNEVSLEHKTVVRDEPA